MPFPFDIWYYIYHLPVFKNFTACVFCTSVLLLAISMLSEIWTKHSMMELVELERMKLQHETQQLKNEIKAITVRTNFVIVGIRNHIDKTLAWFRTWFNKCLEILWCRWGKSKTTTECISPPLYYRLWYSLALFRLWEEITPTAWTDLLCDVLAGSILNAKRMLAK